MTEPANKAGIVLFVDSFSWPKKKSPLQINYDAIDKWLFDKSSFNEVLGLDTHYHLYFDFDSISNDEEYQDVLNWLESLKDVFGPYTIGGYTNSDVFAMETGLRLFKDGEHFCSIHVIFYTTKIQGSDIQEIMKHNKKTGFEYNVHRLCDPNVYKLNSRQLFRHSLSNKIFGSNDAGNKLNHGNLLNCAKPSQHIVQIKGDEKEITRDDWLKVFHKKDEIKKITPEFLSTKVIDPDEFEINDDLIKMSSNELLLLMNEFEPIFENFEKVMINLFHSPFEKKFITNLVKEWYFQNDDHHNLNTVDVYSDQYYTKEDSNKWFFSIMKHLEHDVKIKYLERYSINTIDENAKVDLTDTFSLYDIRHKNYKKKDGIRVGEFLSDLKRVLIIVDTAKTLYFLKDLQDDDNSMKFAPLDDYSFENKLKTINLGFYMDKKKKKTINAFQVYSAGQNKNIFMKRQIKFFSENPDFFCVFHGYRYQPLETVDMPLIQPFLNHIKEIISDNNEELNEFILNWISYIIQNPSGKTESAIVLTGKYGSGKNTFTNTICELLKGYSIDNVNKIDEIVGRNNSLLENRKLIVCNELSSADSNQYIDFDTLKSIITEKSIIISEKYQPSRPAENVVNLIFLSNHDCPIQILKGDRRYVVSETSDARINDSQYFGMLDKIIHTEGFYSNLFTFFNTRDISNWDKRKLPQTEARNRVINNSKSSYEMFISERLDKFKQGYAKKDAYLDYKNYAREMGFRECRCTTFYTKMDPFCLSDFRIKDYGKRTRGFKLKDQYIEQFEKDQDEEIIPEELLNPE